jgi:hypothetical protein
LSSSPGQKASRSAPLVALAALAVPILLAGVATAGIRLADRDESSKPVSRGPSLPTTGAPGTTTSTAPEASPEPDYIRDIKAQVSKVRGLPWKGPLSVQVVSKAELARRVKEVTARDARPDRLAGDADTLRVLHLIPHDFDYAKAIDDLLAEQVLGFYDPETKELFVADAGEGEVAPDTKVSIAHELNHALTDQHFDFGGRSQAIDDADNEEEYAALSALIEGDAVNLQLRWAEEYLSADEQAEALLGSGSGTEVLQRTPAYLQDSLLFPYTSGTDFVAGLIDGTSFKEVDQAYLRPPTSTEQILHPELYRSSQGWSPPALPDIAAATGCEAVRKNTLGEFTMAELLPSAKSAGQGWNGDAFQTVRCGDALGVVDRWQTDTDDDATRLEKALDTWAGSWSGSHVAPGADGRFSGPDGSGRITRSGSQVDIVLADDAPTADRLEAAVGVLN